VGHITLCRETICPAAVSLRDARGTASGTKAGTNGRVGRTLDVAVALIIGLAGGLIGALIGAYTQRTIARWQIEADNAKVRSAAYREFARLVTPQRIHRSMAATVFNVQGKEVLDQAAIEDWRKELDAASGDLQVVAPETVHAALTAFLESLATEQSLIEKLRGSAANDDDSWARLTVGIDHFLERRWKPHYDALMAAVRADVAP